MPDEKDDTIIQAESKSEKGGVVKWIVIGCAILLLGVGGFFGWKFYASHPSDQNETRGGVKQISATWLMGSFIVNLMDNNGERYLKATIHIEVSDQQCVPELEELQPKIKDRILDLLSSKTYKEIVGFEGKQRLRDEIAVRLNNYLKKGEVRKVYFTEFIIQ